jgi:DNA-binding MarR family transcriptional regulator
MVHRVDVLVGKRKAQSVPPERYGFELPLLLAGAFRAVIDELHAELATRGHPNARPIHGFALQAIGPDGATVSELGRRLGVSKQAATKTAANLEQLGYVRRAADPGDARAIRLHRTGHGDEMLALSAEIFEHLRDRWAAEIGTSRLRALQDDLAVLASSPIAKLGDLPGWLR